MDDLIKDPINLKRLKDRHYIKHAKHEYPTGGPSWWMALFKNKIDSYNRKTNGNFSIIVIDSLDSSNYYAIPYAIVKPYLLDFYLDRMNRWVLSIRNNHLCLHGTDIKIPVEKYHNIFPSSDDLLLTTIKQDLETQAQIDTDNIIESRTEGNKKVLISKRIERDPQLRKEALQIHGYNCAICNFNFENQYGEWGKRFAEVHHIFPLGEIIAENIVTNPKTDLSVVCSNCHAMIHRKKGVTLGIQELRERIKSKYP